METDLENKGEVFVTSNNHKMFYRIENISGD